MLDLALGWGPLVVGVLARLGLASSQAFLHRGGCGGSGARSGRRRRRCRTARGSTGEGRNYTGGWRMLPCGLAAPWMRVPIPNPMQLLLLPASSWHAAAGHPTSHPSLIHIIHTNPNRYQRTAGLGASGCSRCSARFLASAWSSAARCSSVRNDCEDACCSPLSAAFVPGFRMAACRHCCCCCRC